MKDYKQTNSSSSKDESNEVNKVLNSTGAYVGVVERANQNANTNAVRNARPEKYTRTLLDDKKVRGEHLKKLMDGKKTIKDSYTGKQIHTKRKVAQAKYGSKAWVDHALEMDHIVPLKVILLKMLQQQLEKRHSRGLPIWLL